jgi:hypothetical protein
VLKYGVWGLNQSLRLAVRNGLVCTTVLKAGRWRFCDFCIGVQLHTTQASKMAGTQHMLAGLVNKNEKKMWHATAAQLH